MAIVNLKNNFLDTMNRIRSTITCILYLSIGIVALADNNKTFDSLTEILKFHIDNIVETENYYNTQIRRDSPHEKTLLWGENIPVDLSLYDNISLITQEMLSGNNCSDSLLYLIKAKKANLLYAFDISLNANTLIIRISKSSISLKESDLQNPYDRLRISSGIVDDYIYRLKENTWESIYSYELGSSFDKKNILNNNEIQFFVSKNIPKAIDFFKTNCFKGVYLVKPNYIIASIPWVVTNYNINPNFSNNVLVWIPSRSENTIRHRIQECYVIDHKFYNNLLDDYQTTKLYILDPKYTLKGDILNISIVLNELKMDESGGISLTSLANYDTKFKYDSDELEWKETDR